MTIVLAEGGGGERERGGVIFNCIFEGVVLLYEVSRQNSLKSPPLD
jgi:hypothetical protein